MEGAGGMLEDLMSLSYNTLPIPPRCELRYKKSTSTYVGPSNLTEI